MIFNKVLFAVSIYMLATFNAWGVDAYYNRVEVDNYVIGLSKHSPGVVDIYNKETQVTRSCKIENWKDDYLFDAGEISLTSDNIGVLVTSDKFLKTRELVECNNQSVKLYGIQYFEQAISSIIDINFEKKLILAVVVINAQSSTFQAIVSEFDGRENILSGKGFWDPYNKKTDAPDGVFDLVSDLYIGKISLNGRYVAPYARVCLADAVPGVWDIAKKMKVVFPSDQDDSVIDKKCEALFSGEKNLEELGGELIVPE